MSWEWTAGEISLAKELRGAGIGYREISEKLGGRTEKAVRRFFGKNGWTKAQMMGPRGGIGPVARNPEIPLELLADRDRRANAPRTLTQLLMGDPV